MALPNASLIQTAIDNLYLAFANDKTVRNMRTAVMKLNWIQQSLNRLYGTPTDIAITDSADAGVSEFIGGGEGDAFSVGSIFRITSAAEDLTDNAFATAKGSAVALADIYVISGADAVVYLGNNAEKIPFDYAGETTVDFLDITNP